MLVMIASLIGFTIFNFGLASRVQELPNRQDTLETRFSGLEATLAESVSHLDSTSQCMAANVGWVSTTCFVCNKSNEFNTSIIKSPNIRFLFSNKSEPKEVF